MTMKELKIFIELANTPHVSSLAKKIGLTQSAISLCIKSLEKKLGENLFDRIGKKVILNERGKIFLNSIKPHIIAINDATSNFKKDRLAGELHIIASRTIGDYILPQIIYDFTLRYPNIVLSTETRNSRDIKNSIEKGYAHIGLVESGVQSDILKIRKIGSDELLVVSKDKTLSKRKYFIDEILDRIWLIREDGSGTRERFVQELGKLYNEIDKVLVFSSFESIKKILLDNRHAITCISKICVQKELINGLLYKVNLKNLDFKRNFYLIYHKDKYKSRVFTEFIKFSTRYFMDF